MMDAMDELISKSEAIKVILEEEDVCKRSLGSRYAATVRLARTAVEKLPVVDAAPIIHGEWRRVSPFTDTMGCSICDYQIPTDEFVTPYCPWCGAQLYVKRSSDHE